MKQISIDYKGLDNTLKELDMVYPSRIYGDLDLLKANINDKLFGFLSGDKMLFEIDDENKQALLGGKEIEGSVYAICDFERKPSSSEQMYEQIRKAEEQAKKLGIYEKIFMETGDDDITFNQD